MVKKFFDFIDKKAKQFRESKYFYKVSISIYTVILLISFFYLNDLKNSIDSLGIESLKKYPIVVLMLVVLILFVAYLFLIVPYEMFIQIKKIKTRTLLIKFSFGIVGTLYFMFLIGYLFNLWWKVEFYEVLVSLISTEATLLAIIVAVNTSNNNIDAQNNLWELDHKPKIILVKDPISNTYHSFVFYFLNETHNPADSQLIFKWVFLEKNENKFKFYSSDKEEGLGNTIGKLGTLEIPKYHMNNNMYVLTVASFNYNNEKIENFTVINYDGNYTKVNDPIGNFEKRFDKMLNDNDASIDNDLIKYLVQNNIIK